MSGFSGCGIRWMPAEFICMKYSHALLLVLTFILTGSAFARPQPLKSGLTAQADSAVTAADNPAGITRFDSTQIRGDLFYIDSESTWENSVDTGAGPSPVSRTNTQGDLIAPNFSIIKPLADKWFFGFSMLAYSISEDYGDEWVGKYAIQEYDLVFISAYPSIAYKVTDEWSVAASVAGSYTRFEQKAAFRNVPEAGNLNPDDGRLDVDADGFTAGFGVSTLYEFTDKTRIGFNYQSELAPELDGDLDFSGLTSTSETILDAANLLGASVDVDTASPQRASVGIYHEFDNSHAATFDVAWIDFSEFKLAEIFIEGDPVNENDFDYDDIWAYIAGYSFPVSDRFTMAVSGLYVPSMVDDDNRQLSLRLDEIWGAGIGVEWKYSDTLKFDTTFNYIQVGDSPVESGIVDTPDGLGTITGEFVDRDLIILQFGVEWGPGPR
jgi:long-chain fatty acid transport protein